MQLNNILFPAPAPSYNEVTFGGELIWIPRSHGKGNPNIPALVLQCPRGSSKILLYFHGNAEDVGLAYELMDHIRSTLLVHVMAMEYPNYGIYPGKCTAD